MDDTRRAGDLLSERAAEFAAVALSNIDREFPAGVSHTMTGPKDFPRPLDRNPAFYGSFDWHSCVEMHWLLVRLLRVAPDAVPGADIRAALDRHLAPEPLRVEAGFMTVRGNRARQRPYGWSWGLTLTHELMTGTTPTPRAGRLPFDRWHRRCGRRTWTGSARRRTRSGTGCIPTARSG